MLKKIFKLYLIFNLLVLTSIFIFPNIAGAQLWEPIPPYDFLWPLWSPVLSPPDPITGVPTPLVDSLDASTVLTVQPAIAWNPSLPYPYLLYNNPDYFDNAYYSNILYYDPLAAGLTGGYSALQSWPPGYLTTVIDPVLGATVLPIPLPTGYENLITFDPVPWLELLVPAANTAWQSRFEVNPFILTASDLLPAPGSLIFNATYALPSPIL